jgi:hypothetical protein
MADDPAGLGVIPELSWLRNALGSSDFFHSLAETNADEQAFAASVSRQQRKRNRWLRRASPFLAAGWSMRWRWSKQLEASIDAAFRAVVFDPDDPRKCRILGGIVFMATPSPPPEIDERLGAIFWSGVCRQYVNFGAYYYRNVSHSGHLIAHPLTRAMYYAIGEASRRKIHTWEFAPSNADMLRPAGGEPGALPGPPARDAAQRTAPSIPSSH